MGRRKNKSLDMLQDAMRAQASRIEFDLLDDLKTLTRHYGMLKPKDFARELDGLIVKYSVTESAAVHKGLVDRCIVGDTNALKLYLDYYSADSDTGAGIANFLAATQPSDQDLQKLFEGVNGNAKKA